jgi:serine/threonine protein kinase
MALMEIDDADSGPNASNDQWLETSIRLQEDAQRLEHAEQRKFLATHCWRDGGEARYAIKSLKASVIANPETLFQGILDLNAETRFLSSLPYHPNIVRLRGMAGGDRFDPHFFLVLDRLNDTLETRLEKWRRRLEDKSLSPPQPWYKCGCLPSFQNGKNERSQILDTTEWQVQTAHRLCFSFDLSSAMAHLHKYRMMHRDLKPNNIGFDIRGYVNNGLDSILLLK